MTDVSLYSIEAEQSLIGALLIDSGAWARIAGAVAEADFYRDDHRRIFGHIRRLHESKSSVDVLTVADAIARANQTDQTGGLAYLGEIANATPSAANIRRYAEIVHERAALRQLQAIFLEGEQAIERPGSETASGIISRIGGRLESLKVRLETELRPFERIDIERLDAGAPPPARCVWDGLVPCNAVTLMSGHGGTGKTYLALQLAAAVAAGMELLGLPTMQGNVIFFSAEDVADTMLHRLHTVCAGLKIEHQHIAGRLHMLDATGGDPALFRETLSGSVRQAGVTETYHALKRYAAQIEARLIVVDNASDAFDASEIERAKVRSFMRALAQMTGPDGAVLLVTHVDKGTARMGGSSEGYSGSTAWHNSARSRLFLTAGDGTLRLEHQKNNLGRRREPIEMIWPEGGIPMLDWKPGGAVAAMAAGRDSRVLLQLIHDAYARREYVSPSQQSRNHAIKVLGQEPDFPRRKPGEIFRMLRNAEKDGLVTREVYRDNNRKERERWALTPKGLEFVSVAPGAPCASSE